MKLPPLTEWITGAGSSPQETLEKDIRQQIRDLDTQASTLNEAISLLRATLSHSSTEERDALTLLERWQLVEDKEFQDTAPLLRLVHHLIAELWASHLLYNHALRQLYPRLVESKRQNMHHWVSWLQKNVDELPDNRQPLVRSLLDNCVQGTLSAGVQQLEHAHSRQLQQVRDEARRSPRLEAPPISPAALLQLLEGLLVAPSSDPESQTSTKGNALAQDDS